MLSAVSSLTIPVTLLLGAEDTLIEAECRATAAAIPQSELVVIPLAAHSPHLENPEPWLRAVNNHLSRVDLLAERR
jgi:pimeloyl-ACP methyl ester carboxylesterase